MITIIFALFPKNFGFQGFRNRGERRKGRECGDGVLTFWKVNGRPTLGEEGGQIGLPLVLIAKKYVLRLFK